MNYAYICCLFCVVMFQGLEKNQMMTTLTCLDPYLTYGFNDVRVDALPCESLLEKMPEKW